MGFRFLFPIRPQILAFAIANILLLLLLIHTDACSWSSIAIAICDCVLLFHTSLAVNIAILGYSNSCSGRTLWMEWTSTSTVVHFWVGSTSTSIFQFVFEESSLTVFHSLGWGTESSAGRERGPSAAQGGRGDCTKYKERKVIHTLHTQKTEPLACYGLHCSFIRPLFVMCTCGVASAAAA